MKKIIGIFATPPFLMFVALFLIPSISFAQETASETLNLTTHWVGYISLVLFAGAYLLAMTEEITELRKSKPMVFAAGSIWILIAFIYQQGGMTEAAGKAFRISLEGYAELFLFIMVSMTYLNAMEDRGVFESLRVWLLSKNFTYRKLFWITGIQAFFISSVCNNLTTALLMGSVILAMGKNNRQFVTVACVNVVVASNAGGAFSPFGDITTLLIWQSGVVPFAHFFTLFIPSIVNFVFPAAIMSLWIPKETPDAVMENQAMKRGSCVIIVLFLLTIVTATCFENFLHLPPAAGMMLGLAYLQFFSYYLQQTDKNMSEVLDVHIDQTMQDTASVHKKIALRLGEVLVQKNIITPYQLQQALIIQEQHHAESSLARLGEVLVNENIITSHQLNEALEAQEEGQQSLSFDVFQKVANLEWDTLLFFYGVMISVSGLSFIGYLTLTSHYLYGQIDPTIANIMVGVASAFVDNGTIMLAVLTMMPDISEGQWLLVTLTAGVGGSLLAVGSAAGVGLMGQAKGIYTFTNHLKWTPVIALGYAASIVAHFLLNGRYF